MSSILADDERWRLALIEKVSGYVRDGDFNTVRFFILDDFVMAEEFKLRLIAEVQELMNNSQREKAQEYLTRSIMYMDSPYKTKKVMVRNWIIIFVLSIMASFLLSKLWTLDQVHEEKVREVESINKSAR